jgi:glycosyltransferase involved in cell wall biosynthesis
MIISILVPAYNEQEVLESFYLRIRAVMDTLPYDFELLFINDGSTDNTYNILNKLRDGDNDISIIDLSRNFGKEIAMTSGLDHCNGDAVIIIDADLQDPPELIPELIAQWQAGYDVVYAQRESRKGETFIKKISAHMFYRFISSVSRVPIPKDTGDFRLMSRRAIDSLNRLREKQRFMKGLYAWIGYPQKAVLYHRDPRYAGNTKWNYFALWGLAVDGITSFSEAPLKIASFFGVFISFGALCYAIFVIIKTLIYGEAVAGYPSLMVVMLLLGGIQLITIGIIGEYIGRTFVESKNRPIYLIKKYEPSKKVLTLIPETKGVVE